MIYKSLVGRTRGRIADAVSDAVYQEIYDDIFLNHLSLWYDNFAFHRIEKNIDDLVTEFNFKKNTPKETDQDWPDNLGNFYD